MFLDYSPNLLETMCEVDHVHSCFLQACRSLQEPKLISPEQYCKQFEAETSQSMDQISFYSEVIDHRRILQYRYKYQFLQEPKVTSNRISSHLDGSVLGSAVKDIQKQYYGLKHLSECFKSVGTQTDYRESECQTDPWEPPYEVRPGHDPEALQLTYLKWNDGLPVGQHEVEIIHRMRARRAWERILPPMDSEANKKLRVILITALETDQWAFKDAEIQCLMNFRMELAEEVMRRKEHESAQKAEARCRKLSQWLNERKQHEIKKIKSKFSRELRKITCDHRAFKARFEKKDMIKKHNDRYANVFKIRARYDVSAVLKKNICERDSIEGSRVDELPSWLLPAKKPSYSAPTGSILTCSKAAKKSEKKLTDLYRNLDTKRLTMELSETCTLLKRKQKIPVVPPTPCRSDIENVEDEVDESSKLLQKLVRGRALQCMILEGRYRYRELIEELRSARALEQDAEQVMHLKHLQEEEKSKSLLESRVNEILESLEGETIAKILNFLNKELVRLEKEKKEHALALLAERQKIKEDITRAGKEQCELNRAKELDEIFRQILKVNQQSVETYLKDIVKEGVEWVSEKNAVKYIVDLAKEVENMTASMEDTDKIDVEGMVSDMVYSFLLPEVEKEFERMKEPEEQKICLTAAHAAIYDEIMNIPPEELVTARTMTEYASSILESKITYESEPEDTEEESSVETDHPEVNDGEESFDRIIQTIINFTHIPNVDYEAEVRDILLKVLRCRRRKQQL